MNITHQWAVTDLLAIVPKGASFSVQEAYWFHPERQEMYRDEVTYTVSVLTERVTRDDLGFPMYDVVFQEYGDSLVQLVAKCRAHFQPGEVA